MTNSKTQSMAKLKLTSHFVLVFPQIQCFTIFCSSRARGKERQLEILGNLNLWFWKKKYIDLNSHKNMVSKHNIVII